MSNRYFTPPRFALFDTTTGAAMQNGELWFYANNTTTKKTIYSDYARTTEATNPVSLNARGEPDHTVVLGIGAYTVVAKDPNGVTLWSEDNVNTGASSGEINVTDYGATGDGETDNSVALQAAIDAAILAGNSLYIPTGDYLYTTALNNVGGLTMRGAGMEEGQSVLKPSGCHGFHITGQSSALAGRVQMRDLRIEGVGTGAFHGFYYDSTNTWPMHEANFTNIFIKSMGGKGLFSETDFSFTMINVQVSACGDNAIDVKGEVCVTMIGCYVHTVADNKIAYRIRQHAELISCNGIDGGDGVIWGEFGETLAEDGVDTGSRVSLRNCNIESFTDIGIRHKFAGFVNCENTSFIAAAAGTFTYYIKDEVNQGNASFRVGPGCSFDTLGATTSEVADVYAHNIVYEYVAARDHTPDGTLVHINPPSLNAKKTSSYLQNSHTFDRLRFNKLDGPLTMRTKQVTTTPYVVDADDHILRVDTTTAAITITLPAVSSANAGRELMIVDEDGNANVNNITVNTTGSDTLAGFTTYGISKIRTSLIIVSDGVSQWHIMAEGKPKAAPVLNRTVTISSSPYTVATNDHLLRVDTVTVAATINLPDSISKIEGMEIIIADTDGNAATNPITIAVDAGDTIQGAASYVISDDWGGVILQCQGFGRWLVVADRTVPVTSTTAALEAVANAINTSSQKVAGYMVYNTTTKIPVWADGKANADIWVDATGSTAHTPV